MDSKLRASSSIIPNANCMRCIMRGASDAKLSHPSSLRLWDFHPPHRFRFVGPVQQLLPNGRPVLLQIVAKLIDRHAVDASATFVAPHLPQCFLQVCSLTHFLHDSIGVGWAFGFIRHRVRFDVFPSRLPGFTRRHDEKSSPNWMFSRLSLSRFMSYLPLLSFGPSATRCRLSLSVDSPFGTECLISLADGVTYYAVC